MSVQIIGNDHYAALFCSTTMHAFGPVFSSDGRHFCLTPTEVAQVFLAWLAADPRTLSESELDAKTAPYLEWLGQQDDRLDAEDLIRAAGGERLCTCGEWFTPAVESDTLCVDCEYEAVRDECADNAYDMAVEEAL